MSDRQNPCDISVIIPCRNEQAHIATTIDRLRRQIGAGEAFSYEVLIVDGESDDGTIEIIERETAGNDIFRVLVNHGRTTPKAFNLGIREARGRFLCIISAHAEVAENYLMKCLEVSRRTDADNVGGPRRIRGQGYIGEAVALAFRSPVAVGGAANHDPEYEGELKTVPGGFFKREVFEKVGHYDEKLIRNQDDELNYRLFRSGGRIWQSPDIHYVYVCRNKLGKLFRQYFQYGYWKVWVIEKHRLPASIRHLIPGLFVAGVISLAALSPFWGLAPQLLAFVLVSYLVVLLIATLALGAKTGSMRHVPILPVVFAILHVAYGAGFLFAATGYILSRIKRGILG